MIEQTTTPTHRIEHDLLGDFEVPVNAYYGVHAARIADNFPISGQVLTSQPIFISALAAVKQAAAVANRALGLLSPAKPTQSSKPAKTSGPVNSTTNSSSI